MPKSIFAAVFVLLAGVLLSSCNTTTQHEFNGCDYGDGVCNQGSRD